MATAPYKSPFIRFIGAIVLNRLFSCLSTLWADWDMMLFPWGTTGKIVFWMPRLFLCGQLRFSLIALQSFPSVVYTVLMLPVLIHSDVFIEDKSFNDALEKKLCTLYMLVTQSMVTGDEMAISRFRPSLHFPLVVIWTQSRGRSKELGKGHCRKDLELRKGGSGNPWVTLDSVRSVLNRSYRLFIDNLNIKYCENILSFQLRCLI